MKCSWVERSDQIAASNVENHIVIEGMETMACNHQQDRPKQGKRFRSAFTTDQVKYLENEYNKFPYIDCEHRKEVAEALNIPERVVTVWFQNRRMKEKEGSIKEPENMSNTTSVLGDRGKAMPIIYQNSKPSTDQHPQVLQMLASGNTTSKRNTCKFNTSDPEVYMMRRSQQQKEGKTSTFSPYASCSFDAIERPSKPTVYKEKQQISPSLNKGFNLDGNEKLETNCVDIPAIESTSLHYFKETQHVQQDNTVPDAPLNLTSRPKRRSTPIDYKTTAEFSIDLCKKYKLETKEQSCPQDPEETKPVITSSHQRLPQDLSCSMEKKTNCGFLPLETSSPKNTLEDVSHFDPAFISVMPTLYAQSIFSSGGMIWKPMTVIPVVPSGTAGGCHPMPSNSSNPVTNLEGPKSCNCDCHSTSPNTTITYPQYPPNQTLSQPQYFITNVPLQNTSSKH